MVLLSPVKSRYFGCNNSSQLRQCRIMPLTCFLWGVYSKMVILIGNMMMNWQFLTYFQTHLLDMMRQCVRTKIWILSLGCLEMIWTSIFSSCNLLRRFLSWLLSHWISSWLPSMVTSARARPVLYKLVYKNPWATVVIAINPSCWSHLHQLSYVRGLTL